MSDITLKYCGDFCLAVVNTGVISVRCQFFFWGGGAVNVDMSLGSAAYEICFKGYCIEERLGNAG